MDQIYLINMERSLDRLAYFQKQIEKHGFPKDKITIWKATDAMIHTFTPFEEELLKHMPPTEYKTVKCNFLSHYYVWQNMYQNKYEHVLVLQDDVQFANGIMDDIQRIINVWPDDAEIINIGLHSEAVYSHFVDFPINQSYDISTYCGKRIDDYICKYHDGIINACSLAYLIKASHATTLFRNMKNISRAIDCFFLDYLRPRNIFYGSLRVLATGNALRFKSTVFPEKDVSSGHLRNQCGQGFISCEKKGILRCGKCKDIFYCSAECQQCDWNRHKLGCIKR